MIAVLFARDDSRYKELKGYVALQKSAGHQQRVELDDRTLNNMLGTLDKHGWQEIAV